MRPTSSQGQSSTRAPVAVSAAVASANAAAITPAYKAAPPRPAYGWTGFYLGGNFGLSAGRNATEFDIFNNVNDLSSAERFHASPAGVAAGGQIGFNWQVARNWVLGVEADVQGSTQREFDCLGCLPNFQNRITQTLPWFATARGRWGFTNGPALFYATGGLAVAKVETDVVFSSPLTGADVPGRINQTKLGWTAGGGIEAQIVGNLTGKVEYLYMDLGSVASDRFLRPGPNIPGLVGHYAFSNSEIRDHVIRVGLNYKFGEPLYVEPAPGSGWYKAPPMIATANWSGIYVGGNAGLSIGHNSTDAPYVINGTFFGGSPTFLAYDDQLHTSPWGAVGGAQVGINWQAMPHWVAGLEADFQASGQRDSICMLACAPPPFSSTFTLAQSLPWFGTVRARAGYAKGPALFYLTGGLAYGRVTTDVAVNDTNFGGVRGTGTFTSDKAGWTVGGGVEAQLVGNLTGKIEYLYLDFGSVTGTANLTGPLIGTGTAGFSSRVQDHIMRAGLNYRFGNLD